MTENMHKLHVDIPKYAIRFIVGRAGENQKYIQKETNTKIIVKSSGLSMIKGFSESDVNRAHCIIKEEILKAKKRINHRPTHFISLPMSNCNVMETFSKFKDEVLSKKLVDSLDENHFQKSSKLHLTLGVMTLLDEEEKEKAVEILERCKKEIVEPYIKESGPIKVYMKGTGHFGNTSGTKANVVFSRVHSENDCVQILGDKINEYFKTHGLVKHIEGETNLKLHVTLINAKYKKYKSDTKKRYTFDVTKMLDEYKDFHFGEVMLDSVHISVIHSEVDDTYETLSSISCSL